MKHCHKLYKNWQNYFTKMRLALFSTHKNTEGAVKLIDSSWKFMNKDKMLVISNFERKNLLVNTDQFLYLKDTLTFKQTKKFSYPHVYFDAWGVLLLRKKMQHANVPQGISLLIR